MPRQLIPRRYLRSQVRNHLASHYLLGLMTPCVRQRMERLLLQDPTLWKEIENWQLTFEEPLASQSPPARVWRQLHRSLDKPQTPFLRWRQYGGWLIASVLLVMQGLTPDTEQIKSISYLAMMSSDECRDCFVLQAFQGDRPGRSGIRVQYGDGRTPTQFARATLWMRDKKSGALVYLAPLHEMNEMRYLTPSEWTQLKNSSELVVKENDKIMFEGRCVTL
ncbi:MAG: hypothetical protein RSD49_01135 [Hafnia sp.]